MLKFTLSILVSVMSSFAHAGTILNCQTENKIDGWNGSSTHEYLVFTAEVESNTTLKNAEILGAYKSDIRTIEADPNYKPRSDIYKTYNKFEPLEDAWNWFVPLLPKDLLDHEDTFAGYIQLHKEDVGYSETIKMECEIVDDRL